MQTITEVKTNRWRVHSSEPSELKIEFTSCKELRNFINSRKSIIKSNGDILKLIRIKKIKQSSMEAIVQKITLREYNLEALLN